MRRKEFENLGFFIAVEMMPTGQKIERFQIVKAIFEHIPLSFTHESLYFGHHMRQRLVVVSVFLHHDPHIIVQGRAASYPLERAFSGS